MILPWTRVYTVKHFTYEGSWLEAFAPFNDFFNIHVRDFTTDEINEGGNIERITVERTHCGPVWREALGFENRIESSRIVIRYRRMVPVVDERGVSVLRRHREIEIGKETLRAIEETGKIPGMRRSRGGLIMDNLDAKGRA